MFSNSNSNYAFWCFTVPKVKEKKMEKERVQLSIIVNILPLSKACSKHGLDTAACFRGYVKNAFKEDLINGSIILESVSELKDIN